MKDLKQFSSKSPTKLFESVWLFPIVLFLIVIGLSVLKINGSSIGVYHEFFYGDSEDQNLIVGKPRTIRSDEWIVNTQRTIAQSNNSYERINKNIGLGEDVSLSGEAPYKEWSTIFKPQNLVFFLLPFDNAFSFRWWFMGLLVAVSCYFFVISLLPRQKLLASLSGIALIFSPFIQWWYLYGTLGTIYYCLFGAVIFMKILKTKDIRLNILWGLLLSYVLTCFALILYPPFQIPAAFAMLAFAAGYAAEKLENDSLRLKLEKLGIVFFACVIAAVISITFLHTRSEVVNTIQKTVYPGERQEKSGGYNAIHLLSSHLSNQFQSDSKANTYSIPENGLTNQSESSNFLFLFPFLLIPTLMVLYAEKQKKRKISWSLITTNAFSLIILFWLFVPGLEVIGKLTFFDQVPANRFLIGLGLLNIIQLILFIRSFKSVKSTIFDNRFIIVYCFAIFAIQLWLGFYAMQQFPGFISQYKVIALSIPFPVIVYLLLKKRFMLALIGFAVFSIFSSGLVNPVYRGTEILSATPLTNAINETGTDNGKWATDQSTLENIALLSGRPSVSGVYTYPQLHLWKSTGADEDIYNRYAHTAFSFDRDSSVITKTQLNLIRGDIFGITTEPCSEFMHKNKVRYILTAVKFDSNESCLQLLDTVDYPARIFYIYTIK